MSNKLDKVATVFINHMWTDNINQFGLLSYYCSIYKKVYFFAWIEVKELLEFYFKNTNNIEIVYLNFINDNFNIITYNTEEKNPDILVHGHHDYLRNDIYKDNHEKDKMSDRKNFIKFFYEGYGIPYIYRISYFSIQRNYELENIRYNEFINEYGNEYILYHESIDEKNIGNKYKNLIRINLNKKTNTFFDYIKILENSKEIHLRDSSWAGICYHLNCKYNLFNNIKFYLYADRGYGYVTMFSEPVKLNNWYINKLNNCLFVYCENNLSSFIDCLVILIHLSKKYEKIFLLLDNNKFDLFKLYSINFLKTINNIILLSKNNEYLDSYDFNLNEYNLNFYFNNLYNIDNKNIYNIENNFYYLYKRNEEEYNNMSDINFYKKSLLINNINISDLYNISYILSDEEYNLNKIYYEKLINIVGKEYILVFNNSLDNYQDIFSLKYYNSEFNKNNYKIIYFKDIERCNEEIYIKNIIGDEKILSYYFDIISNAKEVHFINSFPANFYKYIFEIFKDYFKNVKKYIYPLYTRGYNNNIDKLNININNINSEELIKFHNMNFICPIIYFSFDDNILLNKNMNSYKFSLNSGNNIKFDKHIFKKINLFSDLTNLSNQDQNILNYLNKYIINLCCLNQMGVCSYNNIIKKLNIINIDLDNNKINNDYEIKNLNNDIELFLKDELIFTNFIYLKSIKNLFYLNIDNRELDNDYNIISNNNIINNNNYYYIKLINDLINNNKINYIFPYNNDDQKIHYDWLFFNSLHDPNNFYLEKYVFTSGSYRLLYVIKDGFKKLIPIHSMIGHYYGINFLGKLHNTKQHIQFINWIKDNINIPENILPLFLTSFNKNIDTIEDTNLLSIKKDYIKKNFNNCEIYIFEICSIKLYIKNNFYVQYELTNDYETIIQDENELYNDLEILYNLIPKGRKIIFQTHFRPNIIFNDDTKLIKNRELIFNTVQKFSLLNKNVYHYDPSIIIQKNNLLFDNDTHFTHEGYIESFKYLYNTFIEN
jgi:hypothetical protein